MAPPPTPTPASARRRSINTPKTAAAANAPAARSASPEAALEAKWGGAGAATPSSSCSGALPLGVAIQSHLDGGNIDVLGGEVAADGFLDARLAIHPDPYCETDGRSHFMWFNFRVTGCRGVPLRLRLTNASQASFPNAWHGYQALASHDLEHWFRVEQTSYDGKELVIELTPDRDYLAVAYFAPFTLDQHEKMIAKTAAQPGVRLREVGETLDGHALAVLTFGGEECQSKRKKKKTIWVVCRQHPGESQASWFATGLAESLADPHNPKARALLRSATVHLCPNACPDGTFRGHLRTNAAGANLNREWRHEPGQMPDLDCAPEAYFLTKAMDEEPPSLLIDVHGDEELPHVFIAGAEGVPGFYKDGDAGKDSDTPLGRAQARLTEALITHAPDFQLEYGYPKDAPNGADMRILSNAASYRYNALGATLEMPFKRLRLPAGAMVPGGSAAVSAGDEDIYEEWGPKRCARLGRDFIGALLEVSPHL
jgi:murein tripeptide amidase MpaA